MLAPSKQHFAEATIAIFAAAVADYRPPTRSSKIKRSQKTAFTLQLVPIRHPGSLAARKGQRLIVGFARETDTVAENARKKLKDKERRPHRRQRCHARRRRL
jgi:phosphopantothenoylcysteine decarboxylase/phosphopantothenate--cysteine ligase